MSKQLARKMWIPVVWTGALAVVAAAGIAGASHVRAARKNEVVAVSQAPASAAQRGRIRADLDALPLAFEANQGQTDPQVRYMARGNGYTTFLTANETVFAMQSQSHAYSRTAKKGFGVASSSTKNAGKNASAAIRMKLVGANVNPQIVAEKQLPGHSNYFIGNDPSKWQTGVKQYARVSYSDVYPGVNLAFHGQQRQLEFDFIVAPGASAESIRFNVAGAKRISSNTAGDLVLTSAAGDVVLHKPVSYQTKNGAQESVDSRFVVANNTISFEVGRYDHSRELVIDPSVSYATYLGGTKEDDANAVAVGGNNAYVTGQTASTDFPIVNGGYQPLNKGGFDVFVSKLSADGTALEYSTYVGGTTASDGSAGNDSGNAIALDASGNAYVAGGTTSTNFPVSSSPYQVNAGGKLDAFVFELASNGGSLVFSTYLGGTADDIAYGVAVDTTGVYLAGTTSSTGLQSTGVRQPALSGAVNGFVAKLDLAGNTRIYFTYLGAGGESLTGLAIDGSGHAFVTGSTVSASFPVSSSAFQKTCGGCPNSDAFVSVLLPDASNFVYSTFLGGSSVDQGLAIAVDGSGDAYVTGATKSSNFPTKPVPALQAFGGTQNAFVTELNPTGSALIYSTYLGGSTTDMGTGIAVDSNKNAYIVGRTNSQNFPTAGATQPTLQGGFDAFVSEINASGSALLFSTFLGGTQDENTLGPGDLTGTGAIAIDPAGTNIYVASRTSSSDFPVTAGVKQGTYGTNIDAYIAKFSNTGFSITNGPLSPASGHAGVAANATITVASTGGFAGQVQLACAVSPGSAKAPTCTLTPSSVTLTANGSPQTAALNVATTAASAKLENPFDRQRGVLFALVLPVFGMTLLGVGMGSANSRRKKLFGIFLLGIVLLSLCLLPACSSSSTTVGGGSGGTPNGAYTITVTGSSGGTQSTGSPPLTLTIN